jgi:hypothetical protein
MGFINMGSTPVSFSLRSKSRRSVKKAWCGVRRRVIVMRGCHVQGAKTRLGGKGLPDQHKRFQFKGQISQRTGQAPARKGGVGRCLQ